MAGMYPTEQSLTLFGEQISWPGLDPVTGKFTNGSFTNPQVKPSFIPAQTLNLILDNLMLAITAAGLEPNNTDSDQLKNALALIATASTAIAILTKLKTVDGTGSGLDADLLDGQDGSYFQNAANLNAGTVPVARMPAFSGEATSNAGSTALSLTASSVKLKAWPVGCTYVQYADSEANTYDTAFPANLRPASLFGGSWAMKWEDSNKVFWRSGGSLTAEYDRNNGLQGDAIRNITGYVRTLSNMGVENSSSFSGAFYLGENHSQGQDTGDYRHGTQALFFDASRIVAVASENRPINRRMIIWKRTA